MLLSEPGGFIMAEPAGKSVYEVATDILSSALPLSVFVQGRSKKEADELTMQELKPLLVEYGKLIHSLKEAIIHGE
jgi:hypothetical protein